MELVNAVINSVAAANYILSFLDQKYNMLILSACINHVWCPVLRAELLSMPRLVKLKTHLLFQPVA